MGRHKLEFTSRACKRCGDIYPREQFMVGSGRYRQLSTLCIPCHRLYHRDRKRMAYADPVQRQAILDYNREYRTHRISQEANDRRHDRVSRQSWATNRCNALLADGKPGHIIVYLTASTHNIADHPADHRRPWRRRAWAIRDDRPGMTPPRGGVPIMRISGTNAIVHGLCPDEWQWVAKYTGNWLRRRYQEAE